MAFQIERHPIFLAGVQNRSEALDKELQACLANVGYGMPFQACRQRRKEKEMAPAMCRRAGEARQCHLALLPLAQEMSQPHGRDEIAPGFLMNQLADLVRNVVRVRTGGRASLVAPFFVGSAGLPLADELQCLGAGLIAEGLPLQVNRDGEDFQSMFLCQFGALVGIGFRSGVGVAPAQIKFPRGLLPAVEPGLFHEVQPAVHRHIAELPANQTNLVVRTLAEPVRRCLLEAHDILRG